MEPPTKEDFANQLSIYYQQYKDRVKFVASTVRGTRVVHFCDKYNQALATGLNWWELRGPAIEDGTDEEDHILDLLATPVPGLNCELGSLMESYTPEEQQ